MFKKLEGYKSYIGAVALFVWGGFYGLGWIDQKTFTTVISIIAGWTAFGLRSAINKMER